MRALLVTLFIAAATPASAEEKAEPAPATAPEPEAAPDAEPEPQTWGSIDPGNGFEVAKTALGELRVSVYILVRYLNQIPSNETFTDHLGNELAIDTRNDIQIHRMLLYFMGWIYLPKFRYNFTVWTVNSTTQVALVGNLNYTFSERFKLFGGITGLPGTRTMQGSHPLWLAHDRVMADEFFRPGFTSGVWVTGEVLPRLFYTVMVGNSLSQLGITAKQLSRDLAYSGSVWWMPTTGEFGPRGGFGDWECHASVATRFGASFTHSREDRFSQVETDAPDNTQVKLSDSLNLFAPGALAPGVTVEKATFDLVAVDVALKWRGLFLMAEGYYRHLGDFLTDGAVPDERIVDLGFYVQAAMMVVPRRLELYASTSFVFGEYNDSWEALGGLNWFPAETRNLRVNVQGIYVDRSPVSSLFGFYVGGHRGPIFAVAASVLF